MLVLALDLHEVSIAAARRRRGQVCGPIHGRSRRIVNLALRSGWLTQADLFSFSERDPETDIKSGARSATPGGHWAVQAVEVAVGSAWGSDPDQKGDIPG